MVADNESRLPFSLLLSARWYVARDRVSAAFTIIAIATSVSMAVALEMSTRSVRVELERTADVMSGSAQLEVTGGSLGVPEVLLEEVRDLPGVQSAAPLIEWTVMVREGPIEGYALHILGLDFLKPNEVREYSVSDGTLEVPDPLRLVSSPGSLVVTGELLRRGNLELRDSLSVGSEQGEFDLIVRGVILPGGVADAFGGQVGAMDIYLLQALLERPGWFDRIDVEIDDGADVVAVGARLEELVAGRATVRRSRSRGEYAERAFGTAGLAVWLIAIIGVLVASFLSYTTMSRSVDRRIAEFALLQGVGLEPSRVRRLVRVDALLLGAASTVIGSIGGLILSRLFFGMFSSLSYLVQTVAVDDLTLSWTTVAVGAFVGIAVSFVGSIGPAARATDRPPIEVLRGMSPRSSAVRMRRRMFLIGCLIAVLVAVATAPSSFSPALALGLFYGSALVLLALTVVPATLRLLPMVSRALERADPGVAPFVGAALITRPLHSALTVSSIAGVAGGLAGIIIVLTSVGDTIHDWIASRYPGGIIVSVSDPFGAIFEGNLPLEAAARIANTPGIVASTPSHSEWVLVDGEEVLLLARSMVVMAERGRLPVVDRQWQEIVPELRNGSVAVSEAFSAYFGVSVGQTIELDTPSGPVGFPVAALVRDYFGSTGSIHIDIGVFDRHWKRAGSRAVVVWSDLSNEAAASAIRARFTRSDQPLFVTPASEYANYMDRVFGRLEGLLFAVAGLAAILGGVAIVNLMSSSIADRRRELALLQVAGATRRQLVRITFADALFIAGTGTAIGLLLGIGCSGPMLSILKVAMGWTVQRSLDPLALCGVGAAILITSLSTAIYPARIALSVRPGEVVAPE